MILSIKPPNFLTPTRAVVGGVILGPLLHITLAICKVSLYKFIKKEAPNVNQT